MARRTTRSQSTSPSPPKRHRSRLSRGHRLAAVIALGLGACTGEGVVAPPTTVVYTDEEPTTRAVLPEILASPTVDAPVPTVDTDPSTYFVSPALGDDSNDGQTAEQPFASLQAAIDRLQPGETLLLLSGRYDELSEPGNAHYTIDVSGTADDWIRLTAAPGAEPEIVASDGNGIVVRGNYVEVSGLRLRGEGFGIDNDYGWGLLIRNAHHVRIADNTIFEMAVGGIASVESSNLDIVGNDVFDNAFWGPEQGSGISLWHSVDRGFGPGSDGYHDRIVGNRVYRNENKVFSEWHTDRQTITDGNGIIVDQTNQTGYTGRILVANNLIFDNGGRAVLVLDASRVDIIFNTAYHNGRTPDLEGGPVEVAASRAESVRVFNNLIWARSGVPPFAVDKSAEVEMGGNLLVTDTSRPPATELDLVVVSDAGLVSPGVDPATADFRPLPTSAAIGRSIATDPRIAVDIDGLARPLGAGAAGAYEPGVGTSSTD